MRFLRMIIIIILFLFVFLLWDVSRFFSSPVQLSGDRLIIASGDGYLNLRERLLFANNALLSQSYYRIYTYIYGGVVKPGVRVFSGLSLGEILASLAKDPVDILIRLPEGERMEFFAAKLSELGIVPKEKMIACFRGCYDSKYSAFFSEASGYEGFLFPDTYSFLPNSPSEEILARFLDNFKIRFDPLAKKYAAFLHDHSLRDVVILASLLEREANTLEDKKIVAGILYNRLAGGIRLDVDATVLYVKGDWRASLTVSDLAGDSPYNTRRKKGLPPGPICNPGLESLEAALSPAVTSYLYYLTGSNGKMYYAKTLEEHNMNKQNHL